MRLLFFVGFLVGDIDFLDNGLDFFCLEGRLFRIIVWGFWLLCKKRVLNFFRGSVGDVVVVRSELFFCVKILEVGGIIVLGSVEGCFFLKWYDVLRTGKEVGGIWGFFFWFDLRIIFVLVRVKV